jgi:hypothetical protein
MPPRRKLGQILVESGLIDEFQLRSALSDQKRWGRPLGVTLIKLGFLEEGELVHVLSQQLDVPIVDLRGKRIAPDALSAIPVQVAEKSRCIPLFRKQEGGRDVLFLGMEDPTDLQVLDDLAFRTGIEIRPVLVGPDQLTDAIERYYHRLEWEAESDPGDEVGTLVEPGDTAPLVFQPSAEEPPEIGPEMLQSVPAPAPAAVPAPGATPSVAPESEAGFEFAEPLPTGPRVDPDGEPLPREGSAQPELEVDPEDSGQFGQFLVDAPEEPPRRTPEVEPQPTAPPKPRDVPTRTILRAVTQLLIERKVLTREELMETIRILECEGPFEDA